MLRKTIRLADAAVNRVVSLLCLLLFLICLYATVDAVNVYLNANDTSVLKYKPELGQGGEALRRELPGAVAWLVLNGTGIDYPVMQGENNDTYINTDPYGSFSLSGSIFLDSRNSADFSDPYSMIYGHHMEHGAMFGALDRFIEPEYFSSHRTGLLLNAAGHDYQITLFAACLADASEPLIFDPPESDRQALLDYLQLHAAILAPEDVTSGDTILALSTCQSAESIERMIVFGVLRERSGE